MRGHVQNVAKIVSVPPRNVASSISFWGEPHNMTIRVLLADDHQMVRQALKALLDGEGFQVCGEAGDGEEAIRLASQQRPDVAVLDVAMPVLNGLEAAPEIKRVSPKTKIVLLTMHSESHYVLRALRAGAKGFLLKTHAAEDLVRALHDVSSGGSHLSPEASRALMDAYHTRVDSSPDPLSPRETKVVQLIAEGQSTKQVAASLKISVKTAETHRARIMTKLNIHQTAGLVRYAIRRGLIAP
jgi:DNA-binding NarL/FixJ family response regulator